jgi:hypothetical protein
MNDETNDHLSLLASAYLDGDATADERARVENDPAALAEVDRLRSVRALLGDVEPQSISVREAQLATALDIWDRLPERERTGARRDATPAGIDAAAVAGAASVTAPTALSSRRRNGSTISTRWLAGAAAALVLVLAGGVALQLSSTDDDQSADEATSAEASSDEQADTFTATERAGDAVADELAPAGAATESAPVELDTGIDDAAPPGEAAVLDQLDDLTDLADFAAAAVGAPVAPEVPAATSAQPDADLSESETLLADAELPLCLGVDFVVGPAVFRDVPVVVGVDESRNLAFAYRAATCAEVARVRLP